MDDLADRIELELSRSAYMQSNESIRILRKHIASAAKRAIEKETPQTGAMRDE